QHYRRGPPPVRLLPGSDAARARLIAEVRATEDTKWKHVCTARMVKRGNQLMAAAPAVCQDPFTTFPSHPIGKETSSYFTSAVLTQRDIE
ncbi:MAG: hypothetical protein QOI21_5834, partial [Actinomycetota bacterium]|nr:hypothetical protein [Actinomycetota bacterium]